MGVGLLFPHAAQAIAVTRRTRKIGSRRWRTETLYALASLTPAQAGPALVGNLAGRALDRGEPACTGSETSPSMKTDPKSAPATARG